MKTFPKLAQAAMLAAGVSGLALAAPAAAKDKKAEVPAKPQMKLTPALQKAAQVAQPAIIAKDFATAEPAVVQAEAAAVTDDDKYIAAALRYSLEQQKLYGNPSANPKAPVDETVLARPLDVLIANPSTPAEDRGRYAYRRGILAYNGKQYPQAVGYFAQARQLGFASADLDLLQVKAKMDAGDVAGGNADMERAIAGLNAAGQKAPEDYYRYAIAKANARKMAPEAAGWLRRYAAAYPTRQNWRDIIVTYGLQQNAVATLDNAQKIDLFRLMRASGGLADQTDYLDYAEKLNDKGLPYEAQAVLKEGTGTGKVPTANQNAKLLLGAAASSIRIDVPLATTEARAVKAADGKLAAATAEAYLGQDNYAKAIELYRLSLQKGGTNADETNTRLGIALARSGDKAGAKAAFAAVQGKPRADIAAFWTVWLDNPVTA